MLPNWVFDCVAFRTLKPGPRAVLWELIRRHNGSNNGRIGFSQRDMSAAINVTDRETVAGYVRELEARGFIEAKRRGGFNVKVADRRASEWALAMFPIGDAPATKAFTIWRFPKNDGTEKLTGKDGKSVPQYRTEAKSNKQTRGKPSASNDRAADVGTELPSTYTSLAIGSAQFGRIK